MHHAAGDVPLAKELAEHENPMPTAPTPSAPTPESSTSTSSK
ncbi:hypothetical protein [Streptomyces sp. enrichment culture]